MCRAREVPHFFDDFNITLALLRSEAGDGFGGANAPGMLVAECKIGSGSHPHLIIGVFKRII